jgi:CRISPR-associated protein Csx17
MSEPVKRNARETGMPEILLTGCTAEPLMNHLKALGVFRLVAEQVDPSARGYWRGGAFTLLSTLDGDGLAQFFMERYQPTPIIGPWGARSGFFPEGSETSARRALEAISASTAARLAPFRDTIAVVRSILDDLGIHAGRHVDQGDNQLQLMRACRNKLPDQVLPWLVSLLTKLDRNS